MARTDKGVSTHMEPTTSETPMAPAASVVAPEPAPPARSPLSHPNELLTRKPMPTREHTFRLQENVKKTVLLQGLTYMEKNEIDMVGRQELVEDEKRETTRPNLWQPRQIAKAMRNPDGSRAFPEEHQWRSYAVALAEQLPDAEIHRAANVVMELSGYGKDAEDEAGKA